MGKPIQKAGRPHRTPGAKAAPRAGGATQGGGKMRDRAQAADSKAAAPKPEPQGGTGS